MDTGGIRLVLFDLDGTLVDSVPDLTGAANALLARLGRDPVSEAQVRHWVGDGIAKLVERVLSEPEGAVAPAGDQLQQAQRLFREAYAGQLTQRSRPYPGAEQVLETLRARGFRLACVTNKDTELARRLLEHLDLLPRFDLAVGGDRVERLKPDPALLFHAMEALEVTPGQALMVGDSVADVGAARAAGIPIVAVSYGYNRSGGIAGEHPDRVIDSLPELPPLLSRAA